MLSYSVFLLEFPSSFIILSTDCKKRCSGVKDERLSSHAILHIHKHKDVDIGSVVRVCPPEG